MTYHYDEYDLRKFDTGVIDLENDEEYTIRVIASLLGNKNAIIYLVKDLPMYVLQRFAWERRIGIVSKRHDEFLRKFSDISWTPTDLIELIKLVELHKREPPATLTLFMAKPNKDQPEEKRKILNLLPDSENIPIEDFPERIVAKQVTVKLQSLETILKGIYDVQKIKKYYLLYDLALDWLTISTSRNYEIAMIKNILRKSGIFIRPFDLGAPYLQIDNEERQMLWLNFVEFLNRDPNVDIRAITGFSSHEPIKGGRKVTYEYGEATQASYRDDLKKELDAGNLIEGVRFRLAWTKKDILTLYIRNYKSKTIFSIISKPKDFTILSSLSLLSYIIEKFSEYIRPYINKDLKYSTTLNHFLK